ncbi:MAG: ABC transporter permease [Rhodanobacter sp.]
MSALLRALCAERLKLGDTLALWLCVLAPLLVVLFATLMAWTNPAMAMNGVDPALRWRAFIDQPLSMWARIMLPLFVTLEAALLAGLEHGNYQWKHLLALPLPRGTHYLAKLFMLFGLVVLATIVFCLLILMGGLLIRNAPEVSLIGPLPLAHLCEGALATIAAGSLMIAVQNFIAVRWRSFPVAMSSGVAATMIAMFVPTDGSFGEFFPWAMSGVVMTGGVHQTHTAVVVGVIGFCIVAALGVWDFTRRDHL